MKTIIFCGKQNIPLRGHRDDAKYLSKSNINPGNFQAFLDFRIDSGDKVLEEHFQNAPKTATYRSKTIQNEIIECCGELLQKKSSKKLKKIVKEVKKAKYFAVLADEAQDVSHYFLRTD